MSKILRQLTLAIFTLSLMLGFGSLTLAQTNQKVTPPPILPVNKDMLKIPHKNNEIKESEFIQKGLLPGITTTIVSLTGGLSLLFVIIGGLQMLLSYGDPEKFAKGKKIITWALVGLVISMLSYAIVAIIANIKI